MTQKEIEKAIEAIKENCKKRCVPAICGDDCSFLVAIKCMETVAKIPEVLKELERSAQCCLLMHDWKGQSAYDYAIDVIKEKLCGGNNE